VLQSGACELRHHHPLMGCGGYAAQKMKGKRSGAECRVKKIDPAALDLT
jgi:hypothetical protein